MLMYDGMQKCWGSTYRQLVFQKQHLCVMAVVEMGVWNLLIDIITVLYSVW